MKTKVTIKKEPARPAGGFDAVELMRSIRTEIGKEIEGMTFEQEKELYKESAEKLKKYKRVGNIG